VSFASEPGRDDGNLPPLNVVIPDDARELDRDVLAYRREQRAQRRRQRFAWLVRPFSRPGSGGPAAIVPLIAACLALSLVGGALLSVVTMSPASAPTLPSPASASPTVSPTMSPVTTTLPAAARIEQPGGKPALVRSLDTSAIALVPAQCGCGPSLRRLAAQAVPANVSLDFVGTGQENITQVSELAAQDGGGVAMPFIDLGGVLGTAYRPDGLTVLFIFSNGTAEVVRDLSGSFQLGGTLNALRFPGPTT
jgi:hypothetical protein